MRFLVIQQKRIGDVLLSTIICNNLKKKFPNSTIDFMCYANSKAMLIGNPNIDNVIVLSHKVRKSYFSLFRFIFEIRIKKYDVIIDVYNKLETNLITLFTGARMKIAYHKWYTSVFYTHNLKRFDNSKDTNYGLAIENRLLLLEPFDLTESQINPYPKLYISPEENKKAVILFEEYKINKNCKSIMISLLGSEENKTYPIEFMAKVIDNVAKNNTVTILFNYFENQIDVATKIFHLCSKDTQEKICLDLLGNDLRSFVAILNRCDLIIGNDGGAINMAKALHKPAFTIFSPFVEKKTWATFEDGLRNISVHLNDYKPELLSPFHHDEIKKNYASFYQEFNPGLFEDKLNYFLKINL